MKPVKILLLCGSSVATATLADVRIQKEAKARAVAITTYKGKVMDARILIESLKPNIVVATAMSNNLIEITKALSIKCFSGLPLITGIGQQEFFEELFKTIKEVEKGA